MKSILPIVCLVATSGIASASIINVNLSGSMQDIFDPTDIFEGGDSWYASIEIDTDMTNVSSTGATTLNYSGSVEYQFGNGPVEFFDGSLQVTNGDPNEGTEFDVLAIRAIFPSGTPGGFRFYALDFGADTFDSTDLPPLGLTFDTFTDGVVGNTYEMNGSNGLLVSADIVVDTITVTPSPSGVSLLAVMALGTGCRRRRN